MPTEVVLYNNVCVFFQSRPIFLKAGVNTVSCNRCNYISIISAQSNKINSPVGKI